ncbi:MAG: DASH family cryptochrome [Balneolaceae bacterium]|nr:DASH family cryptochrome [Balneolaceae bacterium]
MKRTLVWFRNDLRIHDNEALASAFSEGEVLPVYIFDDRQFGETSSGFKKTGAYRAQFLRESVVNLNNSFQDLGGDLLVLRGLPETIIPELVARYKIDQVYFHKEVTSEEVSVEQAVQKSLSIPTESFWGSTLFHPSDLPFDADNIPSVFTPFRKKLEKYSTVRALIELPEKPKFVENIEETGIPELIDLGLTKKSIDKRSVLQFKGGEQEALNRLRNYLWETDNLARYKFTRNGLLGADYSSKFSPWLANGTISPRKIYHEIKAYEDQRTKNESTYWLIFELIWRDYFRLSALRYGDRIFKAGGIQDKNRNWSTDRDLFDQWANAETGIPFIDANMRELNQTGFMSNRGRQNMASFLAQNLNLDWRMGAEYFESMLIDYDVCSNYGNWAYNATVGHDPRNRFFNIIGQAKRYDAKGEFVKHWIPELKSIPQEFIHEPHKMNVRQKDFFEEIDAVVYPSPMIDLEKSYEAIKARE